MYGSIKTQTANGRKFQGGLSEKMADHVVKLSKQRKWNCIVIFVKITRRVLVLVYKLPKMVVRRSWTLIHLSDEHATSTYDLRPGFFCKQHCLPEFGQNPLDTIQADCTNDSGYNQVQYD